MLNPEKARLMVTHICTNLVNNEIQIVEATQSIELKEHVKKKKAYFIHQLIHVMILSLTIFP